MFDSQLLQETIESQPYPLMFMTISGAHLYGFASPDSDWDLRGVHVVPTGRVLGLYPVTETIEVKETEADCELDLVTHEVKKFLGLLLKNNGYVLEQLYSPLIIKTTPEHQQLKAIARGCITRNHYHHYAGFAKNQWQLFTKGDTHYVKPLLYIYRVLLTGIYLMQTGTIEANLIDLNREFQLSYLKDLIAQKQTEAEKTVLTDLNLEFHYQEYQKLQEQLKLASDRTSLPDTPSSKPELNSFLIQLRASKK